MEVGIHNIFIEFSTLISDNDVDSEGEHFVVSTTGTIFYVDEEDKKHEIGCLTFHVVHLDEAGEAGCSLFSVFDSSRYLFRVYEALFDVNTDWWKSAHLKKFPDIFHHNTMMVLEHMRITDEFRGHGIGLWAVDHAILNYGRDALVVRQPFPLQYSGKMPDGDMEIRKRFLADRKKLVNYYGRGRFKFRQLSRDSDYWIFQSVILSSVPTVDYASLPKKSNPKQAASEGQ